VKHHTRKAKAIFTALPCLHLLHAGFLLGLFFDPGDGGNTFLQNISSLSTNYMSLLNNITPLKQMIQIQGLPIIQVVIILFPAYMGHHYSGTECTNSQHLRITSVVYKFPNRKWFPSSVNAPFCHTHAPHHAFSPLFTRASAQLSPGSVIFLVTKIVLHLLPMSAEHSCN
jgi:hypothetical protein